MTDAAHLPPVTDRFREALSHAKREVQNLNQTEIGIEHLLLGILDTGKGLAIRALARLQVTPEMVRTAIEERVEKGPSRTIGSADLNQEAKDAIGAARTMADRLAARGPEFLGAYTVPYVGTEHLLLGILVVADMRDYAKKPPTIAGAALNACNVSYLTTYEAVCQCLREDAAHRKKSSRLSNR